jgi:hypothetical protein
MHQISANRFSFVLVAIIELIWWSSAGAEIYRCEAGGNVSYQAEPCATGSGRKVDIAPTSIGRDSPPETKGTIQPKGDPKSLAEKLERVQAEKRLSDVNLEIDGVKNQIATLTTAMDAEVEAIRKRKAYAKNNLAGATWEQSLSQEMAAVTDQYRVKIAVSQNRLADLEKEKQALSTKLAK